MMADAGSKIPAGSLLVLDRRAVKKLLRYGKLQLLARRWVEAADSRSRERRRNGRQEQSPLPLPSTDLRPHDTVACRIPKTTLPVFACLTRRSRTLPSGGGRGAPKFPECVGCQLGEDYARRCQTFTPPPQSAAPEVLPPTQRMARDARRLVGLEDPVAGGCDDLREASDLTPTDETDYLA